jgi:hypothetical protein
MEQDTQHTPEQQRVLDAISLLIRYIIDTADAQQEPPAAISAGLYELRDLI